MFKHLFLLTLFTLSLNAIVLTKEAIIDISKAYGYYLGQTYSLDEISKKYPTLSDQAKLSKLKFDLSFSSSIKNIDKIMGKSKVWTLIKIGMINKLYESVDLSNLTKEEAISFISLVEQRAKGKIESPIIETLLILNPNYTNNPSEELNDGYKKRYTSDGSGKAKDIAFSIGVPMSWRSKEASRPNIVRKFISQNGRGDEIIMVMIKDFQNAKQIFSSDINKKYMKKTTPKGSILKDYGSLTIEAQSGYWQRYTMTMQRVRKTMTMEAIAYTIFYDNKIMQILCSVNDSTNTLTENELNKKFKKFEPIFDLVANSLVIPSVYTEKENIHQ